MGKTQHYSRRDRKANAPPEGEAWAWVTLPMMQSAAYRALSASARVVLDRIMREHMEQGGNENGRLKVTWRDFKRAGVLDRQITGAIAEVEALGWAKRTTFGRRVCGEDRGASAQFRLTWLPVFEPDNKTEPTNDWKRLGDDMAEAKRVAAVAAGRTTAQRKGTSRPSMSMMATGRQDIEGAIQRGSQKTGIRGSQRNELERPQRGSQKPPSTGVAEEKDFATDPELSECAALYRRADADLVRRSEAAGSPIPTPAGSAAIGEEHIEPYGLRRAKARA
jgi:hypothetical protein